MDVVAYFQNLMAKGTIGAYISLSVWGILGVFVLVGILLGLKRGFYRSVVRTLCIALAAVGAYFGAAAISGFVYTKTAGMSLLEMFDAACAAAEKYYPGLSGLLNEDMRALVGSFDAEVAGLILSLLVWLYIGSPALYWGLKSAVSVGFQDCSVLWLVLQRVHL